MKWIQKQFKCECGLRTWKLVPQDQLNTMLTMPCTCGKEAQRVDVSFGASSHQIMDAVHAEGGVRIFENGKRKTLETQRAVDDYAARNNCTFGSDDTEQEAAHQRDVKDRDYVTKVTERVFTDFERLQQQKKAKSR